MKNYSQILVITTIILISTVIAGEITNQNSLPLDSVQFKATHNSYRSPDSPKRQIDKYDVWEIELDFGYIRRDSGFVVGHGWPEPKHGLLTLQEWIENTLQAESLALRPLILKLEAKTANPGHVSHSSIRFDPGNHWPENWASLLFDSLRLWIGVDKIVDPEIFEDDFNSQWPSIDELSGKVIISLQDNNDNFFATDLKDQLFIDSIPGLTAWWPPVKDSLEFEKAIESGVNRIILDEGYRDKWSHVLQVIRQNR